MGFVGQLCSMWCLCRAGALVVGANCLFDPFINLAVMRMMKVWLFVFQSICVIKLSTLYKCQGFQQSDKMKCDENQPIPLISILKEALDKEGISAFLMCQVSFCTNHPYILILILVVPHVSGKNDRSILPHQSHS